MKKPAFKVICWKKNTLFPSILGSKSMSRVKGVSNVFFFYRRVAFESGKIVLLGGHHSYRPRPWTSGFQDVNHGTCPLFDGSLFFILRLGKKKKSFNFKEKEIRIDKPLGPLDGYLSNWVHQGPVPKQWVSKDGGFPIGISFSRGPPHFQGRTVSFPGGYWFSSFQGVAFFKALSH